MCVNVCVCVYAVVSPHFLTTVLVWQSSLMYSAIDGFALGVVLLPVVSTHSSSVVFVR